MASKSELMEFLTIESHFGVPQNLIRSYTRNKCSEDLAGIIKEVATILYPDEEFEIFLFPPEPGSYKDIIKLFKKKPLESITAVATIGTLTFMVLTYVDTHSAHKHEKRMQIVDDTAKCLALKAQLEELKKTYEIDEIPEEKLNEVCGNIKLKKLKNDRYQTLQDDDMIASDETIVKNPNLEVVISKKVERADFQMCIEPLPENEDYYKKELKGVIELISLVVKQKKEGKGITWRGTYYGDDIQERGINILLNGEEVTFYMQDNDFKEKIEKHEIVFSSDDNIRVIFDIKGSIDVDVFQNKAIYIKEVTNFNEDVIEHKIKPKKNSVESDDQMTLFN